MKRNTTKIFPILTFLFTLLVLSVSCEKDNDEKNCGCNSDTLNTIPESSKLKGIISYKVQIDPSDDFYNDIFWIGYTDPNCSNCQKRMIVCNEEILKDNFQDLIDMPNNSSEVIFSGLLKETCVKIFDINENSYNRIILTKIERQ